MKSRTLGRIAGNRGAALRSAERILWILLAAGVDRAVGVDKRAPRLALAPICAVAQHFDKTDLNDNARRFPCERLPANEVGIGRSFAGGLRGRSKRSRNKDRERYHLRRPNHAGLEIPNV